MRPREQPFGSLETELIFDITGTTNLPIIIEVSTNIDIPTWTPLLSGVVTNGAISFVDAIDKDPHLYRIRSP